MRFVSIDLLTPSLCPVLVSVSSAAAAELCAKGRALAFVPLVSASVSRKDLGLALTDFGLCFMWLYVCLRMCLWTSATVCVWVCVLMKYACRSVQLFSVYFHFSYCDFVFAA